MVHRTLIQQLDLAHIEEHSSGMVFWHPNGTIIFNTIQDYMKSVHKDHSYQEIRTPSLLSKESV